VPRRTWLFVPGADEAAHRAAARSGADVIVLELEDFTPPELRAKARAGSSKALDAWRSAGAVAAVRINPLQAGGLEDLMGVLAARPEVIMMSKVAKPEEVQALEQATGGAVELVPNVESAAGLRACYEIGGASRRVSALLLASEDMVADLGTVRSRGGAELAYVRARFLVECRAAGVEAIDCPYTFSDVKGAVADAQWAKQLGYRMKSIVDPAHAKPVNRVLTVTTAELQRAKRVVEAFEKARKAGKERAKVDGALIEVPIYAAAKRLIESAARTPPRRQRKAG
jgi:citrate lyase subunit beta/citryl-CoA lyase